MAIDFVPDNSTNAIDFVADNENSSINPSLMNAAQIASGVSGMPSGIGLGALHSLTSFGNDIANLLPALGRAIGKPNLFPQGEIPQLPQSLNAQNIPGYGVGQFAGNMVPFGVGGEILGGLRGGVAGASNLPIASDIANWLGGSKFLPTVARQTLGGAAYGGITNPQNQEMGALKGAAISAPLAAIPGIGGKIAQGINYLKPGEYADQIVNQLSGGRSLEENAQSLAQDIRNSFLNKVQEGNAQYQPIFDAVGNQSLELNNPLRQIYNSPSQYLNLDKDIFDSYDRNLNKVNDQFLNNQTFNNAHTLQSQLGSAIRKLQASDAKGNLSIGDRNTLQGYQEAQSALKNDMFNFLNAKSPNLAKQYQSATQNWAQTVAPYFDSSKISQMAKGELTNPANIANIFKNPEPEVQQVVNDLPDDAKNKILYSILGKTSATKSPENLVGAFKQLDQQGLNSYVPQTLQQQIVSLGSRIKARNAAQMGGGVMAGLAAIHPFGGMVPMEMAAPVAAGAGAMLGRGVGGALQKMMPTTNISFSQSLANLFPAMRAAVIPNVAGGQ